MIFQAKPILKMQSKMCTEPEYIFCCKKSNMASLYLDPYISSCFIFLYFFPFFMLMKIHKSMSINSFLAFIFSKLLSVGHRVWKKVAKVCKLLYHKSKSAVFNYKILINKRMSLSWKTRKLKKIFFFFFYKKRYLVRFICTDSGQIENLARVSASPL